MEKKTMRLLIINRFIINLTAILLLGCSQVQAQTKVSVKTNPKTQPVSENQREKIETIIRECLLKNPAIIREALAVLQTQEEKEKRLAFANNMKELKSEIYSDVDSPVAGNAKGDVAIVVFFDYFCGYCRKTLPDLTTALANDSNIRVIYKEFPIMGAPSQVASRAALAARRQGKYADFHRALLETEGTDETTIKAISDRLGLNYETLKKDMGDPKIAKQSNGICVWQRLSELMELQPIWLEINLFRGRLMRSLWLNSWLRSVQNWVNQPAAI